MSLRAWVPLGASRREWALQHLLWEVFSTPQSQNCTVALWAGISVCLSYQETTVKGKGDNYSGSTLAVFIVSLQ